MTCVDPHLSRSTRHVQSCGGQLSGRDTLHPRAGERRALCEAQHSVGERHGHGFVESRLPPSFLHLDGRDQPPTTVDLSLMQPATRVGQAHGNTLGTSDSVVSSSEQSTETRDVLTHRDAFFLVVLDASLSSLSMSVTGGRVSCSAGGSCGIPSMSDSGSVSRLDDDDTVHFCMTSISVSSFFRD